MNFYPVSVEVDMHHMDPRLHQALTGLPGPVRDARYGSTNWPVIKLWGCCESGQRCSVYVHGCFPYFYARPLEDDAAAAALFADERRLRSLCASLSASLDRALRPEDQDDGGARVRAVTLAKLTPFYGYAAEAEFFLRVELYRPRDVRRAAALLLEEGCVELEGRPLRLQPHESHVNHHMRFFADCGARALAGAGNG